MNTKLVTPTPQTPAAHAVTTWDVDPSHSSAEFAVKHLMIATVRGRMAVKSGTFTWNADRPQDSTASGEVDVASINTGAAPRDDHLRSPDFFDVENHPTLSFTATLMQHLGDDLYRARGELIKAGGVVVGDKVRITLHLEAVRRE